MWKCFLRAVVSTLIITLQMVPSYARAADVPLPPFSVTDFQENVVSSDALKQAQPWVLIVVAPNNQPSHVLLNGLQMSKDAWSDRVTIIVSGDQAAAGAVKKQNDKLNNVRWYRDADGSVLRNLGLSGWPAVLGIVPGELIAWRAMGVPASTQDTQGLVANWIGLSIKP
ncbi:MAG: hypothetical protein ABIU85_01835 [Methylotenera sp.]